MLWEYKTPQVQKIILDGKTLWFYVPDDKQVMKNNFSTIPQHIVVDLFRGKIAIQEKFKVAFIQEEMKNSRKEISLELIPLAYDPTVKKLTLWVDPEKFYIMRTCLEDEFGTKNDPGFFQYRDKIKMFRIRPLNSYRRRALRSSSRRRPSSRGV